MIAAKPLGTSPQASPLSERLQSDTVRPVFQRVAADGSLSGKDVNDLFEAAAAEPAWMKGTTISPVEASDLRCIYNEARAMLGANAPAFAAQLRQVESLPQIRWQSEVTGLNVYQFAVNKLSLTGWAKADGTASMIVDGQEIAVQIRLHDHGGSVVDRLANEARRKGFDVKSTWHLGHVPTLEVVKSAPRSQS